MKRLMVPAVILSLNFLCSCFYIRVDYPWEARRPPLEDFHKIVPFEPGGTVNLKDIVVFLQEKVQARLEAVFPNGEITGDFGFEVPSDKKELEIQLGEGGAVISLTALDGNVKINRIDRD